MWPLVSDGRDDLLAELGPEASAEASIYMAAKTLKAFISKFLYRLVSGRMLEVLRQVF